MSSEAVDIPPNVLSRVISLPLVSSTYGMVSSAYIRTKKKHPCLRSLCKVVEKGVLTLTAVAMTGAKPIIQWMEPQIANNYACMGLDKIEEKLPILHQPSDKIVARASDIVSAAKDAVTTAVTNARELVGRTKEAVHMSVAITKSVVKGCIKSVLGSRVVQVVNKGVDTALTKSENVMNRFFPLTEDELAKEAANVDCSEVGGQKPNYYIRLGSLSSKFRKRVVQQAVGQLRDVTSKSLDVISQLHATVDVDLESCTLAVACNWTMNLQTTCITLVSNLHGLPHNLQVQAHQMTVMAINMCQQFYFVSSFREVANALGLTKGQMLRIVNSLDHIVDCIVHTPPVNWLVVPASPRLRWSPAETEGGEELQGM